MKNKQKSRRSFVKTSAKTIAAGMVFSHLPIFSNANVVGQEKLKLGLVGCGGRGTGAVFQALAASKSVQLVAMGDVFQHEIDKSFKRVTRDFPDQINVPEERRFLGFDAFKNVISACVRLFWQHPRRFGQSILRRR